MEIREYYKTRFLVEISVASTLGFVAAFIEQFSINYALGIIVVAIILAILAAQDKYFYEKKVEDIEKTERYYEEKNR